MIKKVLLVAVFFAAIGMGYLFAQTAAQSSHAYTKEMGHVRIVTLKDRIKNQRLRITEGVAANTMTADQALAGRTLLDNMEDHMKAERQANGPRKIMTRDNYDAYNATLDANSALIHEQKEFFYYYGPYADSGDDYNYYYDAYAAAGAPTPSVPVMEKNSPRIFALTGRIRAQNDRIQKGLDDNTMTADQAKSCDDVLNSVGDQMDADYTTNGSQQLTRAQYASLNATLDANSAAIQESKHYFYYYDSTNLYTN